MHCFRDTFELLFNSNVYVLYLERGTFRVTDSLLTIPFLQPYISFNSVILLLLHPLESYSKTVIYYKFIDQIVGIYIDIVHFISNK